jgi:hypothetical protein
MFVVTLGLVRFCAPGQSKSYRQAWRARSQASEGFWLSAAKEHKVSPELLTIPEQFFPIRIEKQFIQPDVVYRPQIVLIKQGNECFFAEVLKAWASMWSKRLVTIKATKALVATTR